jgi:hypothetical protein
MAAWSCNGEHILFFPYTFQTPIRSHTWWLMEPNDNGLRIIETLLYLERRVFGTCTRTYHPFLSSITGIQSVSCSVPSGQVLSRISTALPPIPEMEQLFLHSHYCSTKLCQKMCKWMDPTLQWALSAGTMLGFVI